MAGSRRRRKAFCYGMFAVCVAGALAVPFYNSVEPTWAGIPFFHWFQFLWIVVTAVVTALAYLADI